MDNVTYTENNQKRIERFVLVIYSIYGINMMIFFAGKEVGGWVDFVLLFGLMFSWHIHIGKYKTYAFRAIVTAVMMQISVVLFSVYSENLIRVLPVFCTFVVILSLYGIPDIIYTTVFAIILIFGIHWFVLGSLQKSIENSAVTVVLNLINIIFLEYIMYIWTKKNSLGSSQLLGAIEELKQAESSKNDFLANVSHEIRTPINSIYGMSEIILRENLSDKVRENVEEIQVAGRNLMTIVSDILDFSELHSGKIELEEEAYNITSTINDIINMAMARMNKENVELIVDCDANIPAVLLGDEKKLRRVIMNLVDNAIKFTERGFITIGIGCRKEVYGINLIITVKDTGIGMNEESLEKLFTSFNQVDASRKRHEGGVGLGLSICNALIQKMGGAITVKSKLGKGSVIRCTIPQKVLDEKAIVSIREKDRLYGAIYLDLEQFSTAMIRDEYTTVMLHMIEQFKSRVHVCRSFAELQRRTKREDFTHVFTSTAEYRAEQEYFDALAEKTKVVVIICHGEETYVTNPKVLRINKPFYVLSIASVLNQADEIKDKNAVGKEENFLTQNVHVLAVDDNRTNLRVIQGLLSHYNIKVTTANSGMEALEKIEEAEYDFVFMDHMMPEMDGVETLHHIRHKVGAYYQNVPIIALTANAVAGVREEMIAEGFNDFLEKPVERSVLERVIKRNLSPEKIVIKKEEIQESEPEIKEDTEVSRAEADGKEEVNTTEMEKSLEAIGVDAHKGILYCSGKEQYIKVLQGYCSDCSDAGVQAERLFEQKDWKNYTIIVHGLKSAMHTIGAIKISEMAKELEHAGKEGRIDYILEHHEELMVKYRELFKGLKDIKWLGIEDTAQEEEEEEFSVLEEAAFDKMVAEMEDAMYDLDEECLIRYVEELQCYEYYGTALKPLLQPVKRKIEMSDYVSAVEMVERIKKKLENGG